MAVAKNDKLDWLPSGWKVEDKVKNGRKVRCFINVKSSQRLYSKASVLRHIRKTRMNNQRSHSRSLSGPLRRSSRIKEVPLPKEPSDCLDWLPPGWITEVKTRKSGVRAGETYKRFIEPSTGNAFYSKPEVSRYLQGKEQSTDSAGGKKSGATVEPLVNGSVRTLRCHKPEQVQEVPQHPKSDEGKSEPSKNRKVIVETVTDERLPPGWIKEIRIKKSASQVRKDPFYTNPTCGYVFRSRVEVFRYLEKGEISKHAYKRRVSGGNTIQSTHGSPSTLVVRSNNSKGAIKRHPFTGKGSPGGISLTNHGNSEVRDTGSDGLLAGNNALLDEGAGVDAIPIEAQKPEGNENGIVCMDKSDPTRSLKDTFLEMKHEGPNEANSYPVKTKSSKEMKMVTFRSKNEFLEVDRSKDKEECEKRSSKSTKRKPEGNRKELVSSRRSSKRLAGIEIEHVTHSVAIERVLRSANRKSTKSEATPSSGSEQAKQAQKMPLAINAPSLEEIVCQHTEPATVTSKSEFFGAVQSKDKEECGKRSSRSSERKPKRNRKEIVSPRWSSKLISETEAEPVTCSITTGGVLWSTSSKSAKTEAMPSTGSKQGEQAQEPTRLTDVDSQEEIAPAASILPEDQATKLPFRKNTAGQPAVIDFSRDPTGGQTTVEQSRNNVKDQTMNESARNNANERFVRNSEPTTTVVESYGREKEQQDSHFSFPWSDPCIEFAYKTLTGAIPVDDTVAIHDYVQHQLRACSTSSNNFTLPDSRSPPGFSLNSTLPPNSIYSLTDPGPPGFSRSNVPSNSGNSLPFPDATKPPGFPRNIVPSNSGTNVCFQDGSPLGFSLNVSPSNLSNNLTILDTGPPGFSRSSVSSNRVDNFALPDSRPPGFSRSSVPSSSSNNFSLPDASPPGFSWSSVPSNSGNNPVILDARPPGFSWSSVPPHTGINLNLAFPDSGPPGFSQKIVPSSKQQPQQPQNPAGTHTQPVDFPPQKGTMFSPWNRN